MSISFNSIPVGLRTPGSYVEFDSSRATNGQTAGINRILLIGQKLADGAAQALMPVTVTGVAQAQALFGRGSMLARMVTFEKAADRLVETTVVALDDPEGGTAAVGTLSFTGPSVDAGTIALMIGGQRVAVTVAEATSAADIAAAAAAKINAATDLPVLAASAAAVVTLTARHKGLCGNEIDLRHSFYAGESLPEGVGLVIVAMAGGAGEPDYAAAFSAIGDLAFSAVAIGSITPAIYADCKVELTDRFGPLRALDGYLWAAKPGSQGALAAFGEGLNSPYMTVMGTGRACSPPWEFAAGLAAVANASGAIDPARPLQTLELPGIKGPNEGEQFRRDERELLLRDGIATFTVDRDGTVRIERAISTYRKNAAGADDVAYLDSETMRTLAYLRQALRSRFATKYPRHKLADDGTSYGAGQKIVTPSVLRADLVALAREWEEDGLVENIDQFKADLIVERNADDTGRADALIPPDIVNGFRQFAGQIQFIL